jgi:peptide/nickel transport system substrate-binding protein
MQCTRKPLDAPEVRRAISATIDRATLISAKLGGAALPARGMLPPSITLAPRGLAELAFDPASAKSVLAPLGARGHELTLVTSTDRLRVGIARVIAQAITDAGLPTSVRTYEFATFFARLGAGDFDLAPLIASEVSDPDVLRWYLHSDAIPPRGSNRARLVDKRIDEALDSGLRTMGEGRRAIYEQLEATLRDAMPYAPLFHEDHVVVTSARASVFRPSVDGRWGALAELA